MSTTAPKPYTTTQVLNNLRNFVTELQSHPDTRHADPKAHSGPGYVLGRCEDILDRGIKDNTLPSLTPITDAGDFLIKLAPGHYRPATDTEARIIDSRQIHEHLEALIKSLAARPQGYKPGDTLYDLLQKASNAAISDAEAAAGLG